MNPCNECQGFSMEKVSFVQQDTKPGHRWWRWCTSVGDYQICETVDMNGDPVELYMPKWGRWPLSKDAVPFKEAESLCQEQHDIRVRDILLSNGCLAAKDVKGTTVNTGGSGNG